MKYSVCGCTIFKYKASKNKVGRYCAGCGKRICWMVKFNNIVKERKTPRGKLTLKYDKYSMQWLVKIGRLTIFATDNYATATEFIKQHQADVDADRKIGEMNV